MSIVFRTCEESAQTSVDANGRTYGTAFRNSSRGSSLPVNTFAAAGTTHLDYIRKRLTMGDIADSVVGRDYTLLRNATIHILCIRKRCCMLTCDLHVDMVAFMLT